VADRSWTTRDAEPSDLDGILALRLATFGDVDPDKNRPDVWRWRFADNPAGAGWIRLADHDGLVVGHYAAVPMRVQVGGASGGVRTFAMSCDTMTHPGYQKQGIFVTLAQELYAEIARRDGVTTVFGFPNAASRPGFISKLGWFDIHVFPLCVKPIRSGRVLQRYLPSRALSGALGAIVDRAYGVVTPRAHEPRRCRIVPLERFDARFDALWSRHADLARVMQVRDQAFLDWRYCAVPSFGYRPYGVFVGDRLEGYFVLRTVELMGMPLTALVDLFPCPVVDADVTRDVLAFTQLRAAEAGSAFVTAMCTPAHMGPLRAFGFLRVPDRFNPRLWYLGARCDPADEPVLRDIRNWYVTYGDGDVI